MAHLDVNDHLVVVGNLGRYQWLSVLLNGLLTAMFAMQMFITVFTHATPDFRCTHTTYNSTDTPFNITYDNQCKFNSTNSDVEIECTSYDYDSSLFVDTVVSQFDLVCESKHYITIVNMAWMASEGIGAVIGSYISDRFGRKPMVIVTCFVIGVFGISCIFSVNLIMYTILRCSMGLVCFAGFTASVSILTEITAPKKRSHAINAIDLFWAGGAASLSLWGFFLRSWKHLQLAISIGAIPLGIICIWALDESPHWLATNGRKQQALDVLNKMARWNKVVAPGLEAEKNGLLTVKDDEKSEENMTETERNHQESCCDLWKYRRVVIRFFVLSAGWMSCAFCYYALSFGVGQLPGSLYLNNFIMCGVEFLAYIFCFSVAWWGRKWVTVGTYMGGAVTLLVSILLMLYTPGSVGITILSFLGKFCISAAWQVILVWGTEIYPTTHRCTLSVLNGVVGRLGIVTAPYMVDLHKFIDVPNEDVILPSIYVVLMVSVGLLHLLPPETRNRKLPETLKEANALCFPMALEEKEVDGVEGSTLMSPNTEA